MIDGRNWMMTQKVKAVQLRVLNSVYIYIYILDTYSPSWRLLELIIINNNIYGLICNKYILYNGLSNYTCYEVIKFCIRFNMYHEKWVFNV
jgi:hypothetical protein